MAQKIQSEFGAAIMRAHFLFGPEVESLLSQGISDLDAADFLEKYPAKILDPEKMKEYSESKGSLYNFNGELLMLADPYMRMPFKLNFWHPFGR